MGTIWGSCTGTSGSKYNIWLDWNAGAYDVVNNTTPVNIKVYLQRNDGYSSSAYSSSCHRWTQFDSANTSDAYGAFDTRNNVVVLLKETNYNILHNPDGTRSVFLSGGFDGTGLSSLTGGSVGSTVTLPTIPRKSSCTATNAQIETATSININRFSSSFTHTLKYTFGSLSGTIATGVGESYGWTVPSSFYAQIPNAKSGVCTITCETYSGGTLIGTFDTTFTASVNETTNAPTVSASIIDTNAVTKALTDSDYKVVKFFSNMGFTITATAKNSATISSRSITCGSLSSTSTSGTLNAVESNVFVVTATDSRGIQSSITYNATSTPAYQLVDYVRLTVSPTLTRTSPTGSTIAISYNGNYYNGSFGTVANTLAVKYRYKIAGTTTWSSYVTITPTKSGNSYSGSENLAESFPYTNAYDFEVVAYDQIYTSGIAVPVSVSQGIPVFDWSKTAFNVNVATTVPALTATTINGGDAITRKYIGTSQNINDYKTAGQYSFYGTNTNAPTTDISTLEVIVYSPDWLLQRWTSMSSGTIWERRWHSATTWSAWNKTINATETVYLPVDFNVFRLTSQTRVNGTGIFPITKISGKLTISSNWIVLPGGYAYEFIMDFALGNAINGAVAMNLKNTIDQIALARRNIIHTTTWGDPYSNATGYGFSDLTSLSGSDSLKVISEYFGGDPYVMSEQGGLYIKVYKKITI